MKRRHILIVIIVLLVAGGTALWFIWPRLNRMREEARRQDLYERYVELATRIVPRVWLDMKWSKEEIPEPNGFEIRDIYRVKCYNLYARTERVWMTIGVDYDVFVIGNREIAEEIKLRRGSGEKPKLTIPEVIARANHYLELLDQEIPLDHAMDVWYGTDGYVIDEPVWRIVWRPCVNGVFFDDSDGSGEHNRDIYMIFHEELGLKRYSRKVNIHPPLHSMEICVSPADAAEKAASFALDVIKAPHYSSWRGCAKSHSISRMMETRLVLFEPNWMLDPTRSTFMTEASRETPKETRLCWRVKFEVEEECEPGETPPPLFEPVIWIFIDAETGECVGANFS